MKTDGMPEVPVSDFDKCVHLLMFLGLSGVVFFDNTRYLRRATGIRRIFFGSFLFSVLIGGLIEIVQGGFLPWRSGDWLDFLFDLVGALCGFLICLLINRRLKPSTNG
jgi:VanZ family protein